MRTFLAVFAALTTLPALAGEPDLSSPPAAVRSYLAAVKANDVETARRCWMIDDDNTSGALDVIVGRSVASRKLVAATEAKFGADGVKLLGRWNRPACTDKAVELTLERLASAQLKENGNVARISIPWQPGDGESSPTFFDVGAPPLCLRRLGEQWRLDANVFVGVEKAASLFGPDQLWPVWRDEMGVMNDLTSAIEKGEIKDLAAFERELKSRVDALKAKYAPKQ
jgi:hypothetical protein